MTATIKHKFLEDKMYTKAVLPTAAALAGLSSAATTITPAPGTTTGVFGGACSSEYNSLASAFPTPTGELLNSIIIYAESIESNPTQTTNNPLQYATDVCAFESSLPSSLESDFSAYVTSVKSFASASSSAIDALITDCLTTGDAASAFSSLLNSFVTATGPLCTATPASNGTITSTFSYSASPTPTTTSSGNPTSSPSTGGAPAPTGMLAGAAAAAGFLGAAIFL
ncbi:hypothetical protein F5Y16DRAFT_159124 [Xylariaceae sp. FL0255]|nr:hypothetical protein F5Y16DRAFT_159124 [Xylariaceae sp. FL0255]